MCQTLDEAYLVGFLFATFALNGPVSAKRSLKNSHRSWFALSAKGIQNQPWHGQTCSHVLQPLKTNAPFWQTKITDMLPNPTCPSMAPSWESLYVPGIAKHKICWALLSEVCLIKIFVCVLVVQTWNDHFKMCRHLRWLYPCTMYMSRTLSPPKWGSGLWFQPNQGIPLTCQHPPQPSPQFPALIPRAAVTKCPESIGSWSSRNLFTRSSEGQKSSVNR